jgi:hypothetical protein
MSHRTIAALALLMCLRVVSASAQAHAAHPDLSGTWVVVDSARPTVASVGDAGFRIGDMGSGWGTPLTIAQRADSLVVEYVLFSTYDLQPPVRTAYAISGAESRNTLMLGHGPAVQRSRVAWRGDTLVITTLHALPPGVATTREKEVSVEQALTLRDDSTLVVNATRAGVLGGRSSSTTTLYRRR